MKNPPGFQLLHCIKAAGTGGESIFSDALRAADTIYSIDRYSFAQLTKFPVTYEYKVGGHHFLDDKPVFEMSPYFPSVSIYFCDVAVIALGLCSACGKNFQVGNR